MAFSPDGKVIVIGSKWTPVNWWYLSFFIKFETALWDVSSGKRLYDIEGLASIYYEFGSLVFSPNGNLLATTEDQIIKIWNVQEYLK